MGNHYDYKSTKCNKLMEKQAKRENNLAEKKAKRLAKEGPIEEEVKPKKKMQKKKKKAEKKKVDPSEVIVRTFGQALRLINEQKVRNF